MVPTNVASIIGSKKTQDLIAVPASETVAKAVATMSEKSVGAILIRNPGGAIDGIFTERDLMTRVVNAGRDPKGTPLSAVMSPNVRRVPSATSLEDALSLMVVHGYRHLLVEDDATVKGIVSLRDLMAAMVIPEAPIAHEGRVGVTRARAGDALRVVESIKPAGGPSR